jgi:hypothetical protein
MNNFEKIKRKHNHFGELCCWFSNGHKCTHPCIDHCEVYDKIDLFENTEDEIFEKETELSELEKIRDSLNAEILQWLQQESEG